MIALIASSRPGGDGTPPTVYTVPWSPTIAERAGGELPGFAFAHMLRLIASLRERGFHPRTLRTEHFGWAMLVTGKVREAMILEFSVGLIQELEMFDSAQRCS